MEWLDVLWHCEPVGVSISQKSGLSAGRKSTAALARKIRCAVYTRKSTDEGLEKEFNSLDAQRESCEAYIASQRTEGWVLVPDYYDDGGISGGTLERPALQRLLRDIEAGLVDVVAGNKIDRLSRSLMDFAKLVETFDAHNVTFVAVTQSFNTTTSLGRLTLNILLSFAQYEREIIGERVRDKIAASKARGMWMGGPVPLGYDVRDRKLVVNEAGAAVVRRVFEGFATIGSATLLVPALRAEGLLTKMGRPFDKGAIYKTLNLRTYLGQVTHQGKVYPGEHQAIVSQDLWDRAHDIMRESPRIRANESRHQTPALLRGLIFAASALGVPGVLITPMSRDLGLTIGELSAPQGLRLALFGLMAPFAGGLILRFGPRRMLILAGLLLLSGLLLTAIATEAWQLWLGLGVILGVAPGLTALQLTAVVATRWFSAHRGLVVGLLGGATATGVLIFLPLAAWIAEHWGWRASLLPSAAGILIMLLLCILFFRDRPQELGLAPLGETAILPVPLAPTSNFVRLSLDALALGVRRPVFWVLAGAFAICGMSSFGISQVHLVPYCGDLGIPMISAAWMLAVIGVADLIGIIGSGWLSDRYDNRWLLFFYYSIRGLALIWLVYSDVSLIGLSIFAVFYGLGFLAPLPPIVKMAAAAFGPEKGPAVLGWILAVHQLAAGAFAVASGVSRDTLGTYGPSFLIAGLLCLVAAAAFLLVRRDGTGSAHAVASA